MIDTLIAIAVVIAALAATYFGGRKSGKTDAKAKTALAAAEKYAKTRKAIDDVEVPHDDPAALRDWLRARDPGLK